MTIAVARSRSFQGPCGGPEETDLPQGFSGAISPTILTRVQADVLKSVVRRKTSGCVHAPYDRLFQRGAQMPMWLHRSG